MQIVSVAAPNDRYAIKEIKEEEEEEEEEKSLTNIQQLGEIFRWYFSLVGRCAVGGSSWFPVFSVCLRARQISGTGVSGRQRLNLDAPSRFSHRPTAPSPQKYKLTSFAGFIVSANLVLLLLLLLFFFF